MTPIKHPFHTSRRLRSSVLLTVLAALALAPAAAAHDVTLALAGGKMKVKADGSRSDRRFVFESKDRTIRLGGHDPREDDLSIVVRGMGEKGSSSGLITLDRERWMPLKNKQGDRIGFGYMDRAGSRGGITRATFKNGKFRFKAKGKNWPWKPKGAQDSVWVLVSVEEETYCAQFGDETSSDVRKNTKGSFLASDAASPGACPEAVCGNGKVELGEQCDDGNLGETDGCNNDCTVGVCEATDFATTYDAIQNVIFDSETYGCTNAACHGSAVEGGLDLRADASFEDLVGVESSFGSVRVTPGEFETSFLYEKLAAKTLGEPLAGGSSMPTGRPALIEEHLEALRAWINGGAPRDLVVEGTSTLLGACLPPADPLKIPVPDPPPLGEGVQFKQTAWSLPAQFENEICMAVYYDLTQTDLVPEGSKIKCPDRWRPIKVCGEFVDERFIADLSTECTETDECGEGRVCEFIKSRLNPDDECFVYNRQTLIQDPQSHHSIMHVYSGVGEVTDPGWTKVIDYDTNTELPNEGWTYKFSDPSTPGQGETCDPLDIDPATGVNPSCSGSAQETVACLGFGPPDFTNLFSVIGVDGNAPQFLVSTEVTLDLPFFEGVYDVLPMKGMMIFNSHAFNLTDGDSTMDQYLNIEFASAAEAQYPTIEIFDASSIFAQDVPPFETTDVCRTFTAPKGAHIARLSSHTHRFGTLWRTWMPPNEPCQPECVDGPIAPLFCVDESIIPVCGGPREDLTVYNSTEYADPQQLRFDPPMVIDGDTIADRTFYYCAHYDNGSGPTSPAVKLQSTSPNPPLGNLGLSLGGGPCEMDEVKCANAGPMRGELCGGDDSLCDSAPGAGDGSCDACNVKGGVTTEDEMFILLGDFFCPDGCQACPNGCEFESDSGD